MAGLVPADSQPSGDGTQSTNTETTGLWDAKVVESYTHRTGSSSATLEAKKFFEKQIVPCKDDLFLWWRAHEGHYSLLSQLAKSTSAFQYVPSSTYLLKGYFLSVESLF